MKRCEVNELKGGEVLAAPVLTDTYQVLLGAGTTLTQEYIEKIKQMGVFLVTIEGDEENKAQLIAPKLQEEMKQSVGAILAQHTYKKDGELSKLAATTDLMIDHITKEEKVMDHVYEIREHSSDLYEHSINVCGLSILTALNLKMDPKTIHDIGVASLLHDLGLRYLTVNYVDREIDELSKADQVEYRKHPVYGYSALKYENWVTGDVRNMVLYHHEQMDGRGYPLRAKMLTLESRVLNICDAFDEMICGIGCRKRTVGEALQTMKEFGTSRYDARILQSFLRFTAVYPTGTYVVTNEGEIAMIVRQNDAAPDRPVLMIVKDSSGKMVDKKILKDMMVQSDIFIERTVEIS
ncbi:MAG: HD domain-containing protein [Lachnospiraceae bacterium]|nr:HD domain-containing protein [Lachnospiraceae bacterium]